jgi:hypothetical protein
MTRKPTPKAVESLLTQFDPKRGSTNPNEHPCQGAEFHSPRPLQVHGYRLSNGTSFWLCGTCRDNVSVYVTLWEKTGGFDWSIQRCFGNCVRNLANLIIADKLTHSQHKKGE